MPNFVDTTAAGECLFCKLLSDELPVLKLAEEELVVAFLDRGPVNRGHALVATRRHAQSVFDISGDEAAAVMRLAGRLAASIQKTFDCTGMTLLQANGRDGGQTVPHFHMHVVPRYPNDGVSFTWPRMPVTMEELERDAEAIALHSPQPPVASIDQPCLTSEA